MLNFDRFSKIDRVIMVVAVLGVIICVYLLTSGDMDGISDRSSGSVIGQVRFQKNDTRKKSKDTFIWKQSRERQTVQIGDSVYAGASSEIHIDLKKGGDVRVLENSLVTFDEIEQQKVLDLNLGQFKLKVNGTMKVAIRGKLTKIEGSSSEIKIDIGADKIPKVTLISGEASVETKESQITLEQNVIVSLPVDPAIEISQKVELPPPLDTPQVTSFLAREILYTWKISDLYEEQSLLKKDFPPAQIESHVGVSWSAPGSDHAFLELSGTLDFDEKVTAQSETDSFYFSKVKIGENYWRVSVDGLNWSETQKFSVRVQFAPAAVPLVESSQSTLTLGAGGGFAKLKISTSSPFRGFIGEVSQNPNFQNAKLVWSPKSQYQALITEPGLYFYRFRTVTQTNEISDWSAPLVLSAQLPFIAVMTERKQPERNDLALKQEASPKTEPRTPSSTEPISILKTSVPDNTRLNGKYNSSVASFTGFLWTLYSSEQYYSDERAPVVSGLGVSILNWQDRSGYEARVKTGVMPLREGSSSQTALKDAEARYHYRFFPAASFSASGEVQISVFAGLELYRSAGDSFVREYNLAKGGTLIEFPVWQRWMTGGELAYGLTPDQSSKYEISGHLNYFWEEDWSFGVGYRFHVFEAASASAAPRGSAPYREGYTEGFSTLNFHF